MLAALTEAVGKRDENATTTQRPRITIAKKNFGLRIELLFVSPDSTVNAHPLPFFGAYARANLRYSLCELEQKVYGT